MISVLSSYKVSAETGTNEILPELQVVCEELHSRGFLGVDVAITWLDVVAACFGKPTERACDNAADILERRIRQCVENHNRHGKDVPLQVCALSVNFPGISRVDRNTRLWRDTVRYLGVCLVVAHRLGTRVVVIGCGSCVHKYHDENNILFITSRNDEVLKAKIRKRFAQGVYHAFCFAKNLLALNHWPNVGLAIDMEPDLIALARTVCDVSDLLREVDGLLEESGQGNKKEHFGISLTWGHILLACDSGLYRDVNACIQQLKRPAMRKRVMHAHVSDHFPGTHRADAPIGMFRQLKTYKPLIDFHTTLLQDWVKKSRTINHFFSGAAGIKLEACQDVGQAVRCRDALASLEEAFQSAALTRIKNEKDRLSLLEHSAGRLGRSEDFPQGINRKIFEALCDLCRRTNTPKEFSVLDGEMLQTIRQFLSATDRESRTQLAMKVACRVLKKMGADILAFWLTDLLDEEWGKSFHREYRDHATHSVYVYLLGLYLFAVSPAVRDLIYREEHVRTTKKMTSLTLIGKDRPTFFAKWALASLTHDIGYPFEAGGDTLVHARKKLRDTFWRLLPLICVLEKAPNVDREDVKAFVDINKALLEELDINNHINAEFDVLGNVFFLNEERNRELPERTGHGLSGFNEMVYPNYEKSFFAHSSSCPSLMQIFDLFRQHKPIKRAEFLDHGFMSAAVLHEVVRLCQSWSDRNQVRKVCSYLLRTARGTGGSARKAGKMRKCLLNWSKSFLAVPGSKIVQDFLKEVYFAVMIHNISPERHLSKKNSGCLYGSPRKTEPPILKDLRQLEPDYTSLPLLPFLLGLCDQLHEWHRFGFGNPLKLKQTTLSPSEIVTYVGSNGVVCFQYNTNIDFDGESFLEHKTSELTRQFGSYWKKFVSIEEPYL